MYVCSTGGAQYVWAIDGWGWTMHAAVVGGAQPCIQQWRVGLVHAYSSGGWGWTMHTAVAGEAGMQQWWGGTGLCMQHGCMHG